jgi:hypothetical protein
VIGAEGAEQFAAKRCRARGISALPQPGDCSLAGAARKADQPLGPLCYSLQAHPRLLGAALGIVASVGVRLGEKASCPIELARSPDGEPRLGTCGASESSLVPKDSRNGTPSERG